MKKTILTLGFLTLGLMATDFVAMTTTELIAFRDTVSVDERADYRTELFGRINTMNSEELALLRASREASKNRGKGGQRRNVDNQPTLQEFDADNDGKISEAEFETVRAEKRAKNSEEGRPLANANNAPAFATLDTNSDGFVDTAELQNHQISQLRKRLDRMAQRKGQGRNR